MQTKFFASFFAASSEQASAAAIREQHEPVQLDMATLERVAGGLGPNGTWVVTAPPGPNDSW